MYCYDLFFGDGSWQRLWWSGFSGQGPSLTSEAGHRPNQGLPNDEQPTNAQFRVQGKGRYESDQQPQDPSADCCRPCGASNPGEPVEEKLLEGASELFSPGKKSKEKEDSQAKESELFQQIGRLQIELEWLKEISAAMMPMTYENWLIMKITKSLSVGSVSFLGYHAEPCITSQLPFVSLRSESWPGSTPLYLEDPACGSRQIVDYLGNEGILINRD